MSAERTRKGGFRLFPRVLDMLCSHFVPRKKSGTRDNNRMDGCYLESGDRLHEDQRRLRPLLCRTLFGTLPRHAASSIRNWLRFDTTPRASRSAAAMARAAHDFRKLNEG